MAANEYEAFLEDRGMTDLATSLLDLRAVYESKLRTITAIQRYVERVRQQHDRRTAEVELLLGEMSRQVGALEPDGSHDVAACLCAIGRRLADARHAYAAKAAAVGGPVGAASAG